MQWWAQQVSSADSRKNKGRTEGTSLPEAGRGEGGNRTAPQARPPPPTTARNHPPRARKRPPRSAVPFRPDPATHRACAYTLLRRPPGRGPTDSAARSAQGPITWALRPLVLMETSPSCRRGSTDAHTIGHRPPTSDLRPPGSAAHPSALVPPSRAHLSLPCCEALAPEKVRDSAARESPPRRDLKKTGGKKTEVHGGRRRNQACAEPGSLGNRCCKAELPFPVGYEPCEIGWECSLYRARESLGRLR